VPNLIGKTPSEAAAALKTAGFTGRATRVHTSNPTANGHVVSQKPPAGTAIPHNVYVDYQIGELSAAPAHPVPVVEKTRVPDIVGKDSASAMNILVGAGLHMNVSRHEPLGGINDRRSGQIAHQEPARGTEVNKGTTVNVRVFGGTR
jgi:serine/threonine-protein kinase